MSVPNPQYFRKCIVKCAAAELSEKGQRESIMETEDVERVRGHEGKKYVFKVRGNILVWDQSEASVTPFLCNVDNIGDLATGSPQRISATCVFGCKLSLAFRPSTNSATFNAH